MKARKAIFAGNWYPDTATECEEAISNFLGERKSKFVSDKKLVGGIVPHAGWYFSGSIACNVIHCLVDEKPPDAVVIFGMHLHPNSPNFIMKQGAWETPFGDIGIEERMADELTRRFTFNIETADNFSRDNTIELQLPFIKYFFRETKIVPIGVPPAESSLEIGKAVAEISSRMGLEVKVIGSTDLTHYGSNYGFTPKGTGADSLNWMRYENDRKIIDTMLEMNPSKVIGEAMSHHNACCAGAVAAAIAAGKQLGAEKAESIAYATSHDKHPGDSFVGYAGIVF